MSKNNDDFLKELLNDFKLEAAEHLQNMVGALLELEKDPDGPGNERLVELIFRETHSMKGAARAVNLLKIEQLCMSMEDVFQKLKKKELKPAVQQIEVFFQAADLLEAMLRQLDQPSSVVSENSFIGVTQQLKMLASQAIRKEELPAYTVISPMPAIPVVVSADHRNGTPANEPVEQRTEKDTVRVATSKLFEVLHLTEELIAGRNELLFFSDQLQLIAGRLERWRLHHQESLLKDDTVKDSGSAEHLKNITDELSSLNKMIKQHQRASAHAVDDVVHSVKQTLLQPFSSLFQLVPRIVRDLSKEYKKEIELELTGGDTEIDRRILEQMKDPLIHLIRNCIDHGIESPEQRLSRKKSRSGKISIEVSVDTSQKIYIRIQDDGAGIDKQKLLASALKSGQLTTDEAAALSDAEITLLIFASGLSTSPFVTDVSGRGLGMAIVAEKVEELGGSIQVESQLGEGTTFTVLLPQTLTTFNGILVTASEQLFLIPSSSVVRAVRFTADELISVETKKSLKLGDELVGIVRLAEVLELRKRHYPGRTILQGLVIHHTHHKLILVVDEIQGEQSAVVKSLGPLLRQVKNIAGASVLGSGKLVPVLSVAELMSSATGKSLSDDRISTPDTEEKTVSVLVAEDSITIRNMLRNYLESAGYRVRTAIDGQEAYDILADESFDIVVSDVEMPRMNGFELTASIRKVPGLEQLPVILVTALESADDRSKGMEAGANAYIVKSSFEKGNLLDTIKRLVG